MTLTLLTTGGGTVIISSLSCSLVEHVGSIQNIHRLICHKNPKEHYHMFLAIRQSFIFFQNNP